MLKRIKTISAIALSFFVLVNLSAQDFIKPLKVQSQISETRLKELKAAVDSLTEEQVHKQDKKYIFTQALQAWKKANPQAITSVHIDKPITDIHKLALKEAVAAGQEQVVAPDQAKLEAEAIVKYPSYKKGDTVSKLQFSPSPTRTIHISGKIATITSVHVIIGFRTYKISDFRDKLFKQGLDPRATRYARANYVNKALSVADSKRSEVVLATYPTSFYAKITKNENAGYTYIPVNKTWLSPEAILYPMIDGKIEAIDKIVAERIQAAERLLLAELKRANKTKKVLLGVNEDFLIKFEKHVIKGLIKEEETKIIEAEKQAKFEAEQAANIAAEKKKKADKDAADVALRKKQAEQRKAEDQRKAEEAAANADSEQKKLIAIGIGVLVAAIFTFLLLNPKTREKFFTKKKKSLDQIVADLNTNEANTATPMEQTEGGLTLDEQLDGDSKSPINLGVIPGTEANQAPTLEVPTLEAPTLQAPGKSTGKPSLIINPDLKVKVDEGSKLKLKK